MYLLSIIDFYEPFVFLFNSISAYASVLDIKMCDRALRSVLTIFDHCPPSGGRVTVNFTFGFTLVRASIILIEKRVSSERYIIVYQ